MGIWQRNLGVSRVRVLVFVPVLHFFSYFLIFRPLKLKYAFPQMEHEQLCQRGRLITENKGYQGRIEALMKWGNGSTGAPIRGQLGRRNLPAARHWKDLRSCAAKCSRFSAQCVFQRENCRQSWGSSRGQPGPHCWKLQIQCRALISSRPGMAFLKVSSKLVIVKGGKSFNKKN